MKQTASLLLLFLTGGFLGALEIAPDDPRLRIEGCAASEIIELRLRKKILRMNRMIPHPASAQYDNPGAVIRFKTDAKTLKLKLDYNTLHPQKIPANGKGKYYINGKTQEEWFFDRKSDSRQLRLPADGTMKEYEIVMPPADSVDFCGLTVNDKAQFQTPSPRRRRWVIYGDDLVSGKAETIEKTVPFQLARLKKYDVVNMGFPGIRLTPWHAEFLSKIRMNALLVLTGRYDSEAGTTLPVFRKNIERFIAEFRKKNPNTKLVFIAPFQCRESEKLTPYRKALLKVKGSGILVLDGNDLVSDDASFYEPDKRHLNEIGLRQFAENLAKKLR